MKLLQNRINVITEMGVPILDKVDKVGKVGKVVGKSTLIFEPRLGERE